MPVRARLKIQGELPWALELKLVQRHGFRVFSRKPKEFVIIEKVAHKKFDHEILINGALPEETQRVLTERCETIYNQFNDPVAYLRTVRVRIRNMALTLSPLQRVFVEEWAEKNLGEDLTQ